MEDWNGTSWSIHWTPNIAHSQGTDELLGVSCASATSCTAVGGYHPGGDIGQEDTLVETWSGKKWAIQTTPDQQAPAGMRAYGYEFGSNFNAVSCISSGCTAVGDFYLVYTDQTFTPAES